MPIPFQIFLYFVIYFLNPIADANTGRPASTALTCASLSAALTPLQTAFVASEQSAAFTRDLLKDGGLGQKFLESKALRQLIALTFTKFGKFELSSGYVDEGKQVYPVTNAPTNLHAIGLRINRLGETDARTKFIRQFKDQDPETQDSMMKSLFQLFDEFFDPEFIVAKSNADTLKAARILRERKQNLVLSQKEYDEGLQFYLQLKERPEAKKFLQHLLHSTSEKIFPAIFDEARLELISAGFKNFRKDFVNLTYSPDNLAYFKGLAKGLPVAGALLGGLGAVLFGPEAFAVTGVFSAFVPTVYFGAYARRIFQGFGSALSLSARKYSSQQALTEAVQSVTAVGDSTATCLAVNHHNSRHRSNNCPFPEISATSETSSLDSKNFRLEIEFRRQIASLKARLDHVVTNQSYLDLKEAIANAIRKDNQNRSYKDFHNSILTEIKNQIGEMRALDPIPNLLLNLKDLALLVNSAVLRGYIQQKNSTDTSLQSSIDNLESLRAEIELGFITMTTTHLAHQHLYQDLLALQILLETAADDGSTMSNLKIRQALQNLFAAMGPL